MLIITLSSIIMNANFTEFICPPRPDIFTSALSIFIPNDINIVAAFPYEDSPTLNKHCFHTFEEFINFADDMNYGSIDDSTTFDAVVDHLKSIDCRVIGWMETFSGLPPGVIVDRRIPLMLST